MEVVRTQDGSLTIKHAGLDETYHSNLGAKTEARELYIERSSIRKALASSRDINVLDVGLGLGYNALTTIEAWREGTADLFLWSLESDQTLLSQLLSGEAPWQKAWPAPWLEAVRAVEQTSDQTFSCSLQNGMQRCHWQIYLTDAREFALTQIDSKFDFIWHDPFSPTKNPEMWNAQWFGKALAASHAHVELMTYSVARTVKDALQAAGWHHERLPGMGTKKHWLKATRPV